MESPGTRRLVRAAVALALLALPGAPARGGPAQEVSLDEGRFVVFRNGERVGTESFWIRRAGSGADARVIAKGEVALDLPGGRRQIALALEARGPGPTLSAYEAKVSGDRREEIAGRIAARRFSARMVTDQGEQIREFPAGPETFILDQSVAHQYFFIGRLYERAPLTLHIIVPREERHQRARLSVVGVEPVTVGGIRMEARTLRLVDEDGLEHRLWVDPQGRVLRVEIPERAYVAERVEPPSAGPA